MTQEPRTAAAALGRYGEELVARTLSAEGWTVLDRNWRCRHGELDIVARDRRALVAVEVKTRRGTAFGDPIEAVTAAKARRLRRLLLAYTQEHRVGADRLRVDVVGVLLPRHGAARLEHRRGVA